MIEPRATKVGVVLALLVTLCAGTGCFFTRTVINEQVRALDPARVKTGESTIFDVVKLLGVPAPRTVQEIGTLSYSSDYLRYTSREEKCFSIGLRQGMGMIPLPLTPFIWCYTDDVYELSIEFEELVVRSVHVTERDTIWTPFQDESDLAPTRVRDMTKAYTR